MLATLAPLEDCVGKLKNRALTNKKNHSYNISHKYCRKSYKGMKNYNQCCQIAHIFNQLVELSKNILPFKPAKTTIKHIWFCLCSFMIYGEIQIVYILTRKLITPKLSVFLVEKQLFLTSTLPDFNNLHCK